MSFNSPTTNPEPNTGELKLAGGRALPKLLFVTNAASLRANVGEQECESVLGAIRSANMVVVDDVPNRISDATVAATLAQKSLAGNKDIKGIVLLGGYDVVPSQIVDCLPDGLRKALPRTAVDADNYIVWNDDVYGDLDGDQFAELPVSRIPDGKSSQLLINTIMGSCGTRKNQRFGLRNVERPLADNIFNGLTGNESMLVCEPTLFNSSPKYVIDAGNIYMWLHGEWWDPSRFWGEQHSTGSLLEAINVANLGPNCGHTVFTCCCWGGLVVDTPAARVEVGRPFASQSVESSVALAFLRTGLTAFIGCTGSHYYPDGAPLHASFWQDTMNGMAPASALLDAKIQFVKGMPHSSEAPERLAIEYKILREFTCLGLGW